MNEAVLKVPTMRDTEEVRCMVFSDSRTKAGRLLAI